VVGNSAIVRYPERGSGAYLLFSPFTNFLTTSSTHCDQHYQLATMGKEAINPGSSTTMKTETVDVTDEETAELHLYKNMHLLPSNEANSSSLSKFNLFNQNLHQNKSEISNPPIVQTPDQHIRDNGWSYDSHARSDVFCHADVRCFYLTANKTAYIYITKAFDQSEPRNRLLG